MKDLKISKYDIAYVIKDFEDYLIEYFNLSSSTILDLEEKNCIFDKFLIFKANNYDLYKTYFNLREIGFEPTQRIKQILLQY